MTTTHALRIARKIAGDRCTVTVHCGEGSGRALRLSGTTADRALVVAREIQASIPADLRHGAGYCLLWLVSSREVVERRAAEIARLDEIAGRR